MPQSQVRRYDVLSDFNTVYDFLVDTFDLNTFNSYLLPAYWEYLHLHPEFDYLHAERMGIWRSDDGIVGVVAFDMALGDAHLHPSPSHVYLLPQMLDWTEQEISLPITDASGNFAGNRKLGVWVTDAETSKRELLLNRGYQLEYREPVRLFSYSQPFSERALPPGYRLIQGSEVDPQKLGEFWWQAFENQGPVPASQTDFALKLLSAPHGIVDLITVVVSPSGEYASALVMWVDPVNKFAYLEPMATHPKHRGLGLATVALTDAMKRSQTHGATMCTGGPPEFYQRIGFQTPMYRERYSKTF